MSKIPLEVELLPGLAESLVEPLTLLMAELGGKLPRKMQEPEDPELGEIWENALVEGFQRDASRLIAVLGDPAFGKPGYALEESEVEELVRGCSALRLALRQVSLADISDEALEGGLLSPGQVPLGHRESFACFWFLGALQELLVTVLDPESASGGGPDSDEPNEPDWI